MFIYKTLSKMLLYIILFEYINIIMLIRYVRLQDIFVVVLYGFFYMVNNCK